MFKVWMQVEEINEDGDPDGEAADPIDVAAFHDLADAEDFIDRVLCLSDERRVAAVRKEGRGSCPVLPKPTPDTAQSNTYEQDSAEDCAEEIGPRRRP